jgi:hypothetical protein
MSVVKLQPHVPLQISIVTTSVRPYLDTSRSQLRYHDPLTQFACVFRLIHDVDHEGLTPQLIAEKTDTIHSTREENCQAELGRLAWKMLMGDDMASRAAIYVGCKGEGDASMSLSTRSWPPILWTKTEAATIVRRAFTNRRCVSRPDVVVNRKATIVVSI